MARTSCPERAAIIGGGYVGLHTAVHLAKHGIEVKIIDINPRVVEAINSGSREKLHVKDYYVLENWDKVADSISATTSYRDARGYSLYIVAVQTPLREGRIDYTPLESAARSLAGVINRGSLIVSETTIYPGGTWTHLGSIIARETGYRVEEDYLLAHVPERINPGSREWTIEKIPRVVGGMGPRSLEAATILYRDCLGIETHPVGDIRVAEASKLLENTFRFVNIAYVNELKRVFDAMGIDVREVVKAASTKPFGYMPFYPGPYIGGPCIPKDTVMMNERVDGSRILSVAIESNEEQPLYYARKIHGIAAEMGARRLLFLGLGYKPNAYTSSQSPPLKVAEKLKEVDPGLDIGFFDPLISDPRSFDSLEEALEWADLVVRWGYKDLKLEKPVIELEEL
ncbi:MAG: nucleotide sugar dehydrogenase [Desulfurococcales archaeon]|nr:nucleotide sugar dehydrogenase [Desulfurococcales archaeon]